MPQSEPVGGGEDITDHNRKARLLASQKAILELAARGGPLNDVFNLVIRAAQEHSGEPGSAAMFLVDPDGTHLRVAAWSGVSEVYARACDGFGIGPNFPSCGLAAFTGQTVVVADVTKDALWAPYLGLATEHGIRACWSYPIRTVGGKVLGTIATYSAEQSEPGQEELDAVAMLSDTVAIVIERQRELEQRKKVENELRDSLARFETLFDSSPVGMYLVDHEFRLRKMSARTRAVFGDITDLFGRDFAEVVHILWPAIVADEIIARFRRTLATGDSYKHAELSEMRRDRNVREYYEWELHRISLPDAQYGVVCYFLDISARVMARQSVQESETRYRRLFEAAKDGILILDAETGKITAANPFMCNLTGMQAEEFLGKELYEIGMFKDIEENKAAFRDLQTSGYFRHEHLPLHNRRGEKVEVEFVANLYAEGDKLVAQCNIRDISERIRLERELAAQAEALTLQARSKDEFLAMLSHELRNPLAPIRAAAHMMRLQEKGSGAQVNPVLQQAREVIERQVANLTKMVSDLSEVSRVISGRVRLEMQPVDLKLAIGHAIQTVSPVFDQRKHAVSMSLCADHLWALADSVRLEEILVNVLNNAAKYTADGGRVDVSCEHLREGDRNYAVLRVRDNGVGIEESLLPRVFDLFTQADRSLDRSSGGLGIGLSLAKRLVVLHDGTIWAQSEGPGKGSEFTVKLPLIPSPVLATATVKLPHVGDPISPEDDRSGKLKNMAVRVLVVDDNVDLVTMLCGALQHKGFIVQCAYTGPDGLRLAQQWQPDIALLDIGLPGLDGYEIARRLRADQVLAMTTDNESGTTKSGTPMKLIAVTGYGRDDDIAHAREAGFDGHMVKPCNLEKLEQMMTAPSFSI